MVTWLDYIYVLISLHFDLINRTPAASTDTDELHVGLTSWLVDFIHWLHLTRCHVDLATKVGVTRTRRRLVDFALQRTM